MKMQDLVGLTDTEVRNSLSENPITKEIADIYSEALAVKDAVIAVAAQDELSKRGDYDYINDRFSKACATFGIELGSSFSDALAESFLRMKDSDPVITRIGKRVNLKDLLSESASMEGIERKVDDDIVRRYGKYINLATMHS